jgi:hypothetical protein
MEDEKLMAEYISKVNQLETQRRNLNSFFYSLKGVLQSMSPASR